MSQSESDDPVELEKYTDVYYLSFVSYKRDLFIQYGVPFSPLIVHYYRDLTVSYYKKTLSFIKETNESKK